MAIHKIDGVDAVEGGSVINSFPKKFVTLECSLAASASITKGSWVQIDEAYTTNGIGSGVKTSTANGVDMVFGVATETVTNSSSVTATFQIKIQTAGKCTFAKVDVSETSATERSLSGHSGAGDGIADHYAAGDLNSICGVVLSEGADDTAVSTVMIIDQGYF